MNERRLAARKVLRRPVTVTLSGGTAITAQTWDLGVDGVSILSPRPISPGTRCVVMLEIPANGASTPVTLEAKSLHSALTGNGVFKVGMCFRDIDPGNARTLEAFIA